MLHYDRNAHPGRIRHSVRRKYVHTVLCGSMFPIDSFTSEFRKIGVSDNGMPSPLATKVLDSKRHWAIKAHPDYPENENSQPPKHLTTRRPVPHAEGPRPKAAGPAAAILGFRDRRCLASVAKRPSP